MNDLGANAEERSHGKSRSSLKACNMASADQPTTTVALAQPSGKNAKKYSTIRKTSSALGRNTTTYDLLKR